MHLTINKKKKKKIVRSLPTLMRDPAVQVRPGPRVQRARQRVSTMANRDCMTIHELRVEEYTCGDIGARTCVKC